MNIPNKAPRSEQEIKFRREHEKLTQETEEKKESFEFSIENRLASLAINFFDQDFINEKEPLPKLAQKANYFLPNKPNQDIHLKPEYLQTLWETSPEIHKKILLKLHKKIEEELIKNLNKKILLLLGNEVIAKAHNPIALFYLGVRYARGLGISKDLSEAFKYYQLAANKGFASAQFALGICYYNEEGVEQDKTQAFEWFQKSANQGNASAQYNLGICYEKGDGIQKNLYKSFKWYKKSSDQNCTVAQISLGYFYKQDSYIGSCQYSFIVKKNHAEAVRLFRLAANKGNTRAQYQLGMCFFNGQGVLQNRTEAIRLFKLAANKNYSQALCKLGECYRHGYGVQKNEDESELYYKLAREEK